MTDTMLVLALIAVLTPNQHLIKEGRRWQVQSLATGRQHPFLQQLAEEHAAYQAQVQMQGHQGWDDRFARLQQAVPECHEFKEVANESWPSQDVSHAAWEMYHSWRQSDGHWSAVNGCCRYWGYATALGSNGVWYACAIFAE